MSIKINNSKISIDYVGDLTLGRAPKLFISSTEGKVKINGTLFRRDARTRTQLPASNTLWGPGDSLNEYFASRVKARLDLVSELSYLRQLKEDLESGGVTYGLNRTIIENLSEAVEPDSGEHNVPFMALGGHVSFSDIRKAPDAHILEGEWRSLVNVTRSEYLVSNTEYTTENLLTQTPFTETTLKSVDGRLSPGNLVVGHTLLEFGLRVYFVETDGSLTLLYTFDDTESLDGFNINQAPNGTLCVTAWRVSDGYQSFGILQHGGHTISQQPSSGIAAPSTVLYYFDEQNAVDRYIVCYSSAANYDLYWRVFDDAGVMKNLGVYDTGRVGLKNQLFGGVDDNTNTLVVVSDDYIDLLELTFNGITPTFTPVVHDALPISVSGQTVDNLSVSGNMVNYTVEAGSAFYLQAFSLNTENWTELGSVVGVFDEASEVKYVGSGVRTRLYSTDKELVELVNSLDPTIYKQADVFGNNYASILMNGEVNIVEMTGSVMNILRVNKESFNTDTWNFEDVEVDINSRLIGGQHPLIAVTPPDVKYLSDSIYSSPAQLPYLQILPLGKHLIGVGLDGIESVFTSHGTTDPAFFFDINSSDIDPILSSSGTEDLTNSKEWDTTINLWNADHWTGDLSEINEGLSQNTEVVNQTYFDAAALKVTDVGTSSITFPSGNWPSQDLGRYYTVDFKYSSSRPLEVTIANQTQVFPATTTGDSVVTIPIDHSEGEIMAHIYNLYPFPIDETGPDTRYWWDEHLEADVIYPIQEENDFPAYINEVGFNKMKSSDVKMSPIETGLRDWYQSAEEPTLQLRELVISFVPVAAGTTHLVLRSVQAPSVVVSGHLNPNINGTYELTSGQGNVAGDSTYINTVSGYRINSSPLGFNLVNTTPGLELTVGGSDTDFPWDCDWSQVTTATFKEGDPSFSGSTLTLKGQPVEFDFSVITGLGLLGLTLADCPNTVGDLSDISDIKNLIIQ